ALRLATLARERGDAAGERTYLTRAVALNDVNVRALWGLANLASANPRAVPEQVTALVNLLTADPLQPEAWVSLGKICQNANLHEQAAQFFGIALEQFAMQHTPPGPDLYEEYAIEMTIGGRGREVVRT